MANRSVEKISHTQLVAIIISFELGSAILVGIGAEAKQDAWIAVLVGALGGMALTAMYVSLTKDGKLLNLYELAGQLVGRVGAMVLAVLYMNYFFYLSARVLRDLLELLTTSVYPSTPIEFLAVTFMLAIAYIVYLGVEVFARTTELLIPYTIGFFMILLSLLVISGSIDPQGMQPILAEGWGRVIKAAFPKVLTFPFGEMIAISFLMPAVLKPEKLMRTSLIAVAVSGILLAFTTFLQITVLTPERVLRTAFPLLSVTRGIAIGYVFERVDGVVVFLLLVGIFIKVGVFFYAGMKGIEYTLKTPYRPYTLPLAVLIALFSILIASNYSEHIEEGLKWVPLYLHIPFQLILPFILWLLVQSKRIRKAIKGGLHEDGKLGADD